MNIHMSMVRSVLAAAAALVMGDVMADTTVSAFRNRFETAEVFTFNQLVEGNGYVWCGCINATTFDENWCTWESVDGTTSYGINQTGNNHFCTADASDQKARLRIRSGSYTFPYMQLGANGGTSYVVVTGGVVRAKTGDLQVGYKGGTSTLVISNGTVSCAYWLTAGRDAATTSRIEVHGGTLTTAYRDGVEQTSNTGNGMIDLASYKGSTATFLQTGGRVHSAGSNNSDDKNIAMAVGNASGAEASVEMTGGEMDIDGILDIPRAGTGAFTMSGGTVDTLSSVRVGFGESSTGTMTISGGRLVANGEFWVGSGANATATVNMTGGILETKSWLSLSRGNDSVSGISSTFNLSGGAVTSTVQHVSIGSFNAPSSSATFNVSGGELYAANDIFVGEYHDGMLNISGTGKVITPANIKISAAAGNGAVALNGGSVSALAFTTDSAAGTASLSFNGGAFNRTGSTTEIIASAIPVTIGANGGTIDIGESDATIASTVTGSGTLTKQGSGTLALSGVYAGGLSVSEGEVTTPGNETLAAESSVVLAAGATASVAASDIDGKALLIETDGHVTLTGVTLDFTSVTEQKLFDVTSFKLIGSAVSVETDVTDYFTVSGATAAHKVVYKDGAIYAVADLTENKWNATEAGAWSDPKNWSENTVPSDKSLVVFERDAVVTCSGTESTKSWLRLVIRNGATVEFKNTDDTTYPEWIIDTDSIEGTGTIILTHCGLNAMSDVTIPSTINLVIQNATSTAADGYDCRLAAADGCTLTVEGGVTVKNFMVTNGSVVFNGDVAVANGARINIASGTTTFNRALTCSGTASLEKASAASVAKGENSTFTQPTVGSSHVDAAIASLYSIDTSVSTWVGGESGNWNEAKNWSYGIPGDSSAAIFENNATIYFDASKTVASIVVNASVMFKTTNIGSVHPTVYIHDVTGTGTIRLYHVGFEGNGGDKRIGTSSGNTLTLEFVSTETDSWLKNVNVYAPIIGAGYLKINEGTKFYGDNSGLTGTVLKDDVDARFMSAASGFPNASAVTINGTIWLWFTEGEIEFGGNFTAYSSYQNWGINLPGGVTDVTLTVGGANGAVVLSRGWTREHNWHPSYGAYVDSDGWRLGTDKLTIRKIGSGAINGYRVEGVHNLSLEGGSMNLGAAEIFAGVDTRLTVTNATLGIARATTLATADFKSDSTLQSTYYETTENETTTYGVNLLTVTGAATMNGATLTATGTTPDTNTVYTVLSAATVSGTATSGIADPDDTDRNVWKARVSSVDLKLKYAAAHPGLFVILR